MATEAQILAKRFLRFALSLSAFAPYLPLRSSTSVEMPLQINPFYAKQTQFPKKSNERKPI